MQSGDGIWIGCDKRHVARNEFSIRARSPMRLTTKTIEASCGVAGLAGECHETPASLPGQIANDNGHYHSQSWIGSFQSIENMPSACISMKNKLIHRIFI